MSQLSRMELAALKRMEMSLNPLKRKLDFLDKKINTLIIERAPVQAQFDKMEEMMNAYAGGVPYEQVLRPEMALPETVEVNVDAEATVNMVETPIQVPTEVEESWAIQAEEESFKYPGGTSPAIEN